VSAYLSVCVVLCRYKACDEAIHCMESYQASKTIIRNSENGIFWKELRSEDH